MSKIIIESGMRFGPYPDDDCFELEKSAIYQRVQHGVMMAEFALIRRKPDQPSTVWLIEAKSSSPQPDTQPNFDQFIEEIRQKLSNALQMLIAAQLKRHPEAETDLPHGFQQLTLQEDWKLVLVIRGHHDAWLIPIQDALKQSLSVLLKTFGLKPTSVAVINDSKAMSLHLIRA